MFLRNRAANGGAIYKDASKMNCEQCTFDCNQATVHGAAIYNEKGEIENIRSAVFISNTGSTVNDVYLCNR